MGRFFSFFSNTGNTPEQYRPESRREFELISLLVPVSENPRIASNSELPHTIPLYETIDGVRYVRFFIHPDSANAFRAEMGRYRRDHRRWIATPTSSTRTVLVRESSGHVPAFQLKLSMDREMATHTRMLAYNATTRAITISDMVHAIHTQTAGTLPGGQSWSYMPEVFGMTLPGRSDGSYVMRLLPPELSDPNRIVIPLYALVSQQAGSTWLEQLHAASGIENRSDFYWQQIAKPLLDFHMMLSMDHGLTAELHQQNALIVIDRATMRIRGFTMRDMDGINVDQAYRENFLGLPVPSVASWANPAGALRFIAAQQRQADWLFLMRAYSLDYLTRGWLTSAERWRLLDRVDGYIVEHINRRFPDRRISSVLGVSNFWRGIHRDAAEAPSVQGAERENRFAVDRLIGGIRQRSMLRIWIHERSAGCLRLLGLSSPIE